MSELYDTFLGPLGKEYCVLFFVMVVVSLINVFLIGFGAIRHIFDAKSKDDCWVGSNIGCFCKLHIFSRTLQYVHEIIVSSYNFVIIKVYEQYLVNTIIIDRSSIVKFTKNWFIINISTCIMNY